MKKLDERQQLIQGKIFKHTILITAFLLFITAFLVDYGYNIAEGMWSYILILLIPMGIGIIEMIWRDAYPFKEVRQVVIFISMGILGVVLIIWTIIEMTTTGTGLLADKSLSQNGANLIVDILYVGILASYIAKKLNDKKKGKGNED